MKAVLHQKESALKTACVTELPRPHGVEGRAPTPLDNDSEVSESDYNDEPLASGSIDPIMVPIELSILGTGKKIILAVLLDLGCT